MTTAVVTGSASGIGAAIRKRFERSGYTVIGIDVRDAEIVADLSTRQGRALAIPSVKQRCRALDYFVACAGLATYARPPSLIASVNYFRSGRVARRPIRTFKEREESGCGVDAVQLSAVGAVRQDALLSGAAS